MTYIQLNYSQSPSFVTNEEVQLFQTEVNVYHAELHERARRGDDSFGWLNYPATYDRYEIERMQLAAQKVQEQSDVLLVIGVGGSMIGTRAMFELLTHRFHNELPKEQRKVPKVYFIGHHLSASSITDLLELIQPQDFSINVISKSGQTLEPALAFRIFRKALDDKYGKEEARQRMIVTTDEEKGALRKQAIFEGYETFTIPQTIGGRYSALSPVGLFPLAVSGICPKAILEGAYFASEVLGAPNLEENAAYEYAVTRNILNQKGKQIELFVSYEPKFHSFSKWWTQLFGESEGKNQQGIFPSSAMFSTDLHSIGQYVQEGSPILFETVLLETKKEMPLYIEQDPKNFDGLNYLNGKSMDYINEQAFLGALEAHTAGGVPNLVLRMPEIDAFGVGYLLYFFQKACAMSSYIAGVNPFNQPGVEAYKKKMYHLLAKGMKEELHT